MARSTIRKDVASCRDDGGRPIEAGAAQIDGGAAVKDDEVVRCTRFVDDDRRHSGHGDESNEGSKSKHHEVG